MLTNLYNTKNRERNKIQVDLDLIKSELIDIKNEIGKMSKMKLKLNSQEKQQILLKRFLTLIIRIRKDKDSKY